MTDTTPPKQRIRPPKTDLAGKRYGRLTVLQFVHHQAWQCLCDCGATCMAQAAELNRGYRTTCGNKRLHQRVADPGYHGLHKWITAERGRATQWTCVDCGQRAHHWSYDNNDQANELVNPQGYIYTTNLDHYEPRCRPCHRQHDIAVRAVKGLPLAGARSKKQG